MIDPLNVNIAVEGIDTSYPLIPEGDYTLQISESPTEANYDQTILVWAPKFVTIEPIPALQEGRVVQPNTKVFMAWPLELEERADSKYPGQWVNTLCDAVDAIFGTDKTNRPAVTKALIESATGKTVLCHIIIDEGKDGVKRNRVKRMKKAA